MDKSGMERAIGFGPWLQQLAEDYPDVFCNEEAPDESVVIDVRDHPSGPMVVESDIWVMAPSGDPRDESAWERKHAWLTLEGCLWMRPCSTTEQDPTSSTLHLGGRCVFDLLVTELSPPLVCLKLGGRRVYAFYFSVPGARGSVRKKYLAAEDMLVRKRWMSACISAGAATRAKEMEDDSSEGVARVVQRTASVNKVRDKLLNKLKGTSSKDDSDQSGSVLMKARKSRKSRTLYTTDPQ